MGTTSVLMFRTLQEAEYIQDSMCEIPIFVLFLLPMSLFQLFAQIKRAEIHASTNIRLLLMEAAYAVICILLSTYFIK